ncbi:sensor histidine kinase [Glycomyces buryatensis]|uniref:Signal transduction histidine kinase subgroup 3 dimerisation and phosphoacceptor domain-containing protein n=1 Tax=Glycomyces buryatensis TaxID=2570927 RepID=A0A4S8QG17_9ACTN|nr:histidine kinase [Glycomyces buryatensis]THV42092.1 hypothetical protein FAB82_07550 [Glycomyces buryatensis]
MNGHSELPVRDLRRLYQYTLWTTVSGGPLTLFIAGAYLAGASDWGQWIGVTVAAMVIVTTLATIMLARYVAGETRQPQPRLFWTGTAVLLFGLAFSAWDSTIFAAWAAPAGLLASCPVLWRRPGTRNRFATAVTVAAALIAAVLGGIGMAAPMLVFLTLLMFPCIIFGVVFQWWNYNVALELEQSRGLAAELAVAEERLRFAAELHDVQGGHLQVIVLKAQLARRFINDRPDAAAAELEAMEELGRSALRDMRALVGGYRRVSLADEVDSAARILQSAGIEAEVNAETHGLDPERERLLGLLVREGTTNLLRHSAASTASLQVEADGTTATVEITNDGASEVGELGNGLAMLAERFAAFGGTVAHGREGDRFTLTGTLPGVPSLTRETADGLKGTA